MVPDAGAYSLNDHSKEQIMKRFNIIPSELDTWVSRLLTHANYQRKDEKHSNRSVYRYRDIQVVVQPKDKQVITVMSKNESDREVSSKNANYNPEVKSYINEAMDKLIDDKKRFLATRIAETAQNLAEASANMVKPQTNKRYIDKNYAIVEDSINSIKDEYEKVQDIMVDANLAKAQK